MTWKMSGHAVTITLPEVVYEQIRQAAERTHRPVEDVLAEAVAATAPVMDTPPRALRSALAHLAYLNDAALWQAARTTRRLGSCPVCISPESQWLSPCSRPAPT
jgi:hypothetical protein